jgi:ribose transport system permease protein
MIENKTLKKENIIVYFIKEYNIIFMLLILATISTFLSNTFFSQVNFLNLSNQLAAPTVIAMGELLVILVAGIDLSVGSIAAVGSVVVALLCFHMPLLPAVICTVLVGFAMGLITGLLIAYVKLAPFIASLAMQTIGTGIAFILSNGSPIITPHNILGILGAAKLGKISALAIIAVLVVAVVWFIQQYTPYGRIILAIGSNESVVRLAGIRLNFYKISVYCISGMCAALGGIFIATRTVIGSPLVGSGMELDAIAAAVIGGASLMGGKGTAVRTLAGVICLGLISNVMNLIGIPSYPQSVVKGVIIILAVALQGFTRKSS